MFMVPGEEVPPGKEGCPFSEHDKEKRHLEKAATIVREKNENLARGAGNAILIE